MAFVIQFNIQGDVQLSRKFTDIGEGVKDFSQPFQKSTEFLEDVFGQTPDYSGSNIGQVWPPLSPSTLKQKAEGSPMLVKTGYMRSAFQHLVETNQAAIWNNATYFKFHQSTEPRIKIPRRAMMALTEALKQSVVQIFHVYLQNLID